MTLATVLSTCPAIPDDSVNPKDCACGGCPEIRCVDVELRQDGFRWTLYVDGARRIDGESFTVVDQVADHLIHRRPFDGTEISEIAERIRDYLRRSWAVRMLT